VLHCLAVGMPRRYRLLYLSVDIAPVFSSGPSHMIAE
jgi:hypothetical protein